MPRGRRAGLLGLALLVVACGSTDAGSTETRTITVFAAASLGDAFEDVAAEFRADSGVRVEFNFLASSDLAAQLLQGAPADVFASADDASMDRVIDEGLAQAPVVFALNRPTIAVPQGNPEGIESLEELEDPELVIALCNRECPAGRYAREIFQGAGLDVEADSLEADVRGVLTRVALREADAGIVYVTDIAADPEVESVPIPERDNVLASYPIVALGDASPAAFDFVAFVRSERGRATLADHGFELP